MKKKTGNRTIIERVIATLEVLGVSTKLGLTSFGGPAAHLAYFREEYVIRRKWLDEQSYADIVALCQFLPGPASSQVGIAIGSIRAGLIGGIAAWIGFTLPSVLVLILFALLLQGMDTTQLGWIHGLKIVAVAVVAHAIYGMGKSLTPDRQRASLAILTAVLTLFWPTAIGQLLIILGAAVLGLFLMKNQEQVKESSLSINISKKVAILAWILFLGLLIGLPLLRQIFSYQGLALFDTFYRVGSLVFGGGHVVLPLLEREVVPLGWVTESQFLAGYGATQAVPGPLFTFASYLGAVISGWSGALIATVAIFLPSFFLVIGTLPFWDKLRHQQTFRKALHGVNAAVVGLLVAALFTPLWSSTIKTPIDFAFALIVFGMLVFWKLPPWLVVLFGVVGGIVL